jgi:WD40 repeat protein
VCWSRTGDRVILDGSVRVWDVSSETCLKTLREHAEMVTSVASPHDSFYSRLDRGTKL